MKDFLRYLFKPRFWFRNYPTEIGWDERLNYFIDSNCLVEDDEFIAKLTLPNTDKICKVWICNYPYAYGKEGRDGSTLPSRRTVEKLARYISLNKKG